MKLKFFSSSLSILLSTLIRVCGKGRKTCRRSSRDTVSWDSTRAKRYHFSGACWHAVSVRLSRWKTNHLVGIPKIFIRLCCTRHRSFGKHLNRPNKRQRKHNALLLEGPFLRLLFGDRFYFNFFTWPGILLRSFSVHFFRRIQIFSINVRWKSKSLRSLHLHWTCFA